MSFTSRVLEIDLHFMHSRLFNSHTMLYSQGSQRNLTLPLNQTSTSALPDVVSPDVDARLLKDQLDSCVAYSRGLQRNFEAVSLKCRKNRDEIKVCCFLQN
jgi:hypothetical protein